MICPKCNGSVTGVKDSRPSFDDRAIRRRRLCETCGFRFTTFEMFCEDISSIRYDIGPVRSQASTNSTKKIFKIQLYLSQIDNNDVALVLSIVKRLANATDDMEDEDEASN